MINKRINKLRKIMKEKGLDAYIISGSDPHQSEYTAERWETRKWITGFTGSQGIVVVTADKAGLWTDSRYYLQAAAELIDTEVTLFKSSLPDFPGYLEWLAAELKPGSTVGSNIWTTSIDRGEEFEAELAGSGINYKGSGDLLDDIWEERLGLPTQPVFQLDLKYSGRGRKDKIAEIRSWMDKKRLSWYLVSSLSDIAWTLNLRGNDISFNPLFMSYLLIGGESCYLFISREQLSSELSGLLEEQGIIEILYENLESHIETLVPGRVNLAPDTSSIGVQKLFGDRWGKVYEKDITVGMKAVKNKVEISSIKNAMKKDGAALVRFLIWLEDIWPKGYLTEVSAAAKLAKFRSMQDGFMGLSFATVAGYNDHGAIIHYSANEESAYTLSSPGVLLLDSGGQYLDGTTDITRVLKSGDVSAEIIHDYTLVLKGHIDLATVTFPVGTKGFQLDILARKALWDEGKNYGHGTGHGVGFFLNVHEGPQKINTEVVDIAIEEGMITSNEPGIYLENRYGIRIENLILAVKSEIGQTEDFLEFETLSMCPLELELIDGDLLTETQKEWVNNYHNQVYKTLSPLLEESERVWLKGKTRRF
ncbi:MAG: aminopeptidase P family protein [Spirochaetales bacterium]|nr:aminopeptidase P family protein [Spirochaetales bacterium]